MESQLIVPPIKVNKKLLSSDKESVKLQLERSIFIYIQLAFYVRFNVLFKELINSVPIFFMEPM